MVVRKRYALNIDYEYGSVVWLDGLVRVDWLRRVIGRQGAAARGECEDDLTSLRRAASTS